MNGFAATSMAAVAARAEVALRTLYNYYPRKEILYLHDYSFFLTILKVAADAPAGRPVGEALAVHLKHKFDKSDEFEDIALRAYDRLLWDSLEEELTGVICRRRPQANELLARVEAGLLVLMIRSLLWPAYVAVETETGAARETWLDAYVAMTHGALSILRDGGGLSRSAITTGTSP